MPKRLASLLTLGLFIAVGSLGVRTALAPSRMAGAQKPAAAGQAPATAPGVIRAEANLVLVDVIATDSKGKYVEDLQQKEFHVFEDGEEQPITSFSRGSENTGGGPAARRYMVLLFDNSTMAPGDQMQARQAAAKFVEKGASADRLMAVVDFGGTLHVAQNFTADAGLLRRAVEGVKFSSVAPGESDQAILASQTQVASLGGMPTLPMGDVDFGARSMLLSIRELAKMLRPVPGRKTVVLFSSGFLLTPERQSELMATIDALNKANIAVYPIDVRGLTTMTPGAGQAPPVPGLPPGPGAMLMESPFPHLPGLWASLVAFAEPDPQRPGGGGGGGAGGGGGGGAPGGGGGASGGGGGGGGGRGGTGSGGTGGTGGGTGGGGKGGTGSGGTGSGGGTKGGGTTGGTGSRGGGGASNANPNFTNNPCNQPGAYLNPNCTNQNIIPQPPADATTNQQVLYALANGTGGFPIFNSNDFLAGLEKINRELSEYYYLGYVPPSKIHEGAFHSIKVKVDRNGVKVRARNGYYDSKSPDLLMGKPEGKALEEQAASPQPGEIPVSVRTPYFFTSPGVARVNLALQVPASALDFEKLKGQYHSEVHVLGLAYRDDNSVAARFSDTVKMDLDKKEWKDFSKGSFPYTNNFDIAPGKYKLKVVLGAGGEKFGKYEVPLVVEPFDGKKLELGGPALSNQIIPASQLTAELSNDLLEERTPLLFQGNQIVPSSDNRFQRDEMVALYVEVYDPLLVDSLPPRVGVLFNIYDQKTNKQVFSSPTNPLDSLVQKGSPLVPVALVIPTKSLQAGQYRVEVLARDSNGQVSPVRKEDFVLE